MGTRGQRTVGAWQWGVYAHLTHPGKRSDGGGGQQNQRGRHTRLVGRGHRVAAKRGGRPSTPATLATNDLFFKNNVYQNCHSPKYRTFFKKKQQL